MFVFPEDKPVIRGIRSVYVDMPRLVQYYRKNVPSGCIHFQNHRAEGVLFFKDRSLIDGLYTQDDQRIIGRDAMDQLSQASPDAEFTIDVLEIPGDQMSFWSGVQSAEAIHTNLSTEFTDLKKLIKKMSDEDLTGYIEVRIEATEEIGRIFFVAGKFIGGTYSWTNHRLSRDKDGLDKLIGRTKTSEGLFTVYSVATHPHLHESEQPSPAPVDTGNGMKALEDLMALAEETIADEKKIKNDFQTLIRKKFVQFVDKYTFLDPFAAEFEYRNGKITYSGQSDEKSLAAGLLDSLQSIMDDCGLSQVFSEKLAAWKDRHAKQAQAWSM
jgi:hypothetical protein